MKNFLNKLILCGGAFFLLKSGSAISQPVSLLPQRNDVQDQHSQLILQEQTGFWEGTPPLIIETYFSKLPVEISSITLRHLYHEVLKEKYGPLLQNSTYEKTLFSYLEKIGHLEQAKEFLLETNLPDKDHLLLDLQWLAGDSKKACEKVTHLLRAVADEEWKKQNIYCLYLNGETERGKIAAELLNESNPEGLFLINALFESSVSPSFDASLNDSPFLLTVWCTIGHDIPEESLKTMSPSSLALIARAEKMPLQTRLVAAEKALQSGALKGEFLLNLLKHETGDELLEKFTQELKSPNAELLLPLFEKAKTENKLGLVAQIFKPFFAKIEFSSETLPLAPYMVRAFLEAGEKDLAQKWGAFFMRESPEDAIEVLPLLHLVFPKNQWGEIQLQAWQLYQNRVHSKIASQNSYTLRHVLEALGEEAGSPLKGESPEPSWRQKKALFDEKTADLLDSAVKSKRRGEVLLLVLILIGETPLKDLVPDIFIHLVESLNKVGYKDEAHFLALEYLIAQGI
ncbi:MAG: hypothetical protein KA112_04385 [Alphaproteobacteria bacterium]|jgi:hypothetical protein|nr:hypothetical protein [Alphaproteobacteria bacterium]MBP7729830.1 hypothetical protein [Alphaproteobacteria bacterium]